MRKLKMTFEYLGTHYSGWERQPDRPSVRGALEGALGGLLGEDIALTVAARTDAGVHAEGNVASFSVEGATDGGRTMGTDRLQWSLNRTLPDDIAVSKLEEVDGVFDARRDAIWREYEYRILNRGYPSVFDAAVSLWLARPLAVDKMNEAVALLTGEHDFSAFSLTGPYKSHRRTVTRATVERVGEFVYLRIRADSFLRGMVRAITGTVMAVGLGERSLGDMERRLTEGKRDDAGGLAPPHGLTLKAVGYAPYQHKSA